MEIKKTLKKLISDTVTFHGFTKEREQIKDLFVKTSIDGESNSALLISQKFGGKTTLVNSVLYEMLHDEVFVTNSIVISLNGLIHTDDRTALKSTTKQMNLEKEVEGKVFNSFSENLSFLLSCLKEGKDKQRLIFIVDEFDLFCSHHNQTLLYNLFDVAQSAQTPICVLGLTSRLDVVELLEKRVKSRFSHRQIFLLPDSENFDNYVGTVKKLMKLPSKMDVLKQLHFHGSKLPEAVIKQFNLPFLRRVSDPNKCEVNDKEVKVWNESIDELMKNEKFIKSMERLFNFDSSIATFKLLLFQVISNIGSTDKEIDANSFIKFTDNLLNDDKKVAQATGLSVLEICLLVTIKHHSEIYDNNPFNFEMIFTRFNKFAIKSSTMQNIEREMALKRFENLKHQEFIAPFGVEGKVQKEYQMYSLLLLSEEIDRAVQKYQNLPTEIEQWAKSDLL